MDIKQICHKLTHPTTAAFISVCMVCIVCVLYVWFLCEMWEVCACLWCVVCDVCDSLVWSLFINVMCACCFYVCVLEVHQTIK